MIRINVQDISISNLYLLLLQIPSTSMNLKQLESFLFEESKMNRFSRSTKSI